MIARHGLAAHRGLGQHFLLDGNLTGRIARAAGDLSAVTTIEVGPGPGGLTRSLLAAGAARLLAIERDSRCVRAIEELIAAFPERMRLVHADALDLDVLAAARDWAGDRPIRIVANLPYNVATPLLIGWLKQAEQIDDMVLMFQKEVADRLYAEPSTKSYGRLSVLAQWRCETARLFDIPARAFVPAPKVTSTVVRLTPRIRPLAGAGTADLERVTGAAFGQRRKMLRASLKTLGGDTAALLEQAGIDGTARAETLSVEQFCALARAVSELSEKPA